MKTGALRFLISQPKQKESSEQKSESAQTKEEQQDFSEPAQIPEKLSDDGDLSDARDPEYSEGSGEESAEDSKDDSFDQDEGVEVNEDGDIQLPAVP